MEGHQADSEAEEDEEDSQFEERSDPGTHQEEKPKQKSAKKSKA